MDWAVVGTPFDNGVTYRNGARFGPRAIREASQYVKPYHMVHDVSIVEELSLADGGDAPPRPYSCQENADSIAEHLKGLPDAGTMRVLMLGGDHSNTLAGLRAAYARAGRPSGGLALVHFDAHLDTVDAILGERYSHASPFIRAVEEGLIDPEAMVSVGIRGPLNKKDDLAYGSSKGIRIITADEFFEGGYAVVDGALERVNGREVYVTFDIDCVDPAYAPGTGTPCPGGFSSREALGLVRRLARVEGGLGPRLAGADVVEVLPDRDPGGATAFLAAHIAFEILAVDARRRRLTRGGDGGR